MSSSEELKSLGNEAFIQNDFVLAENYYTQALQILETVETQASVFTNVENHAASNTSITPVPSLAIILTNRAAARIQQGKDEEGLEDSERAIMCDPKWVKAYYRKANALEKLNRNLESYLTWEQAYRTCDKSAWLLKQIKESKSRNSSIFLTIAVENDDTLLLRYSLLDNSREKLSTLAHFWNDATKEERLQLLQYFLSLIAGLGGVSDISETLTVDMMLPMPLHNYEDLPQSRVAVWCLYFRNLPSEGKISLMSKIWGILNNEEQTAVINDLKLFVSSEMQTQLSVGGNNNNNDSNTTIDI